MRIAAVDAVHLSAYEAAKEFSIPKSTILQHFNGIMKRYI
jgi:hypothetical protein